VLHRPPSPAALRSRRWRAKRKAGIREAHIPVPARRLVAALRARRSRWRRRNGLVPHRIDVDEHGLAEVLNRERPPDRGRGAAARPGRARARRLLIADFIARCVMV
jgi:hypothetical protein